MSYFNPDCPIDCLGDRALTVAGNQPWVTDTAWTLPAPLHQLTVEQVKMVAVEGKTIACDCVLGLIERQFKVLICLVCDRNVSVDFLPRTCLLLLIITSRTSSSQVLGSFRCFERFPNLKRLKEEKW